MQFLPMYNLIKNTLFQIFNSFKTYVIKYSDSFASDARHIVDLRAREPGSSSIVQIVFICICSFDFSMVLGSSNL